MASAGTISLLFALLTSVYAVSLGFLGLQQNNPQFRRSARGATMASLVMTALGSGILWYALLMGDFRFAYVANYTKQELPWVFKFSAFWAGQAGSLLFWLLMLSLAAALVHRFCRFDHMDLQINYAVHGIRSFFIVMLLTVTPAFQVLDRLPEDGAGLNPMLQSFGMIVHPPLVFIGYALLAVAFGIVLAALLRRREPDWTVPTRLWMLWSWLFLTLGIVTGGQWAYTELGWGGYWAWDPVENASLLPWLSSTACLHLLVLQRRGRGYHVHNYVLICLTLVLTIFGTFLTRSGILESVHAFSDSHLGRYFLVLLAILSAVGIGAGIMGRRRLQGGPKALVWNRREAALCATAVMLMLILMGVFVGTMFPLFSHWVVGQAAVLQESFYNNLTIPMWLFLAGLLGVCPFLAWQGRRRGGVRPIILGAIAALVATLILTLWWWDVTASLAFWAAFFGLAAVLLDFVRTVLHSIRQGRGLRAFLAPFLLQTDRFGAHVIHAGVLLIAIGIAGSVFNNERLGVLNPGETMEINGYTLTYDGLTVEPEGSYTHVEAVLGVSQNSRFLGEVRSSKVFHPTYRQPASNVGVLGSLREDVYFNLSGWEHDEAYLQVSVKPLVAWIWIGSYLMYAGCLLILFAGRGRRASAWSLS